MTCKEAGDMEVCIEVRRKVGREAEVPTAVAARDYLSSPRRRRASIMSALGEPTISQGTAYEMDQNSYPWAGS